METGAEIFQEPINYDDIINSINDYDLSEHSENTECVENLKKTDKSNYFEDINSDWIVNSYDEKLVNGLNKTIPDCSTLEIEKNDSESLNEKLDEKAEEILSELKSNAENILSELSELSSKVILKNKKLVKNIDNLSEEIKEIEIKLTKKIDDNHNELKAIILSLFDFKTNKN